MANISASWVSLLNLRSACLGLLLLNIVRSSPCQTIDDFAPNADRSVEVLIPAWDGSVIASGLFTTIDQQPSVQLAKLSEDGVLDINFAPQVQNLAPAIARLPDGSLITAALFPLSGGGTNRSIGKISRDGELACSFPGSDMTSSSAIGCAALQPDGKILFGGLFTLIAVPGRTNILRLNPDGSLDTSFGPRIDGRVGELAVQSDGKIVIEGAFTNVNGQARRYLARLNGDGSLDATFDTGTAGIVVYSVSCLALQPDGKIIVGGSFGTASGSAQLVRLNGDGSLDNTFNSSAEQPHTIAVQADGSIIIGDTLGVFSTPPELYVARLHPDGSVDPGFQILIDTNPIPVTSTSALGPYVDDISLDGTGRLLLGGWFRTVSNVPRSNIARLLNTGPATTSLLVSNSTVVWECSGTGPAFSLATFEATTNGCTWAHLGAGKYVNGRWELAAGPEWSNATLRALGYIQGGVVNGSAWTIESSIGPGAVTVPPSNQTRQAGLTAVFEVQVAGTPPFSFQWLKNGQPLSDTGNVSGSQSSTLMIANVLHADSASYSVLVSNAFGMIPSTMANLTVLDPAISSQPTNVLVDVGQNALLSVQANGTAPLAFQWTKNGSVLVGETSNLLMVSNVQAAELTNFYQVLVRNEFGSLTSAVAQILVNAAAVDSFRPQPNSTVNVVAAQPDKKILVGGYFSSIGGLPCNLFGRLNADGTLDTSFGAGTNLSGTAVSSIAVFQDGSILAGGNFTTAGGAHCLARFRSDGTEDLSFGASFGGVGADVGASVYALAIQDDGKILVGGIFSTLDIWPYTNLARLNAYGSPDPLFKPSPSAGVLAISLQSDGAILVGGFFRTLAGQPRNFLGRLDRFGNLDTNFAPEPDNTVWTIGVQADGKILVGGAFQTIGGVSLADLGGIARLNSDGSIDPTFNPGANEPLDSLSIQTDGAILVAGDFTRLGSFSRSGLGRLTADGKIDPTFDPVVSGWGHSILYTLPASDGATLLGGWFSTVDGQSRPMVARLQPTSPATSALNLEGSTIKWVRTGPGPEVLRASFSVSTNGETSFPLGTAERVGDGWILRNATLPQRAQVTASGYIQCGGGAAWFTKDQVTASPLQPPVIVATDNSFGIVSNRFGFDVQALIGQNVVIEGSSDLYRWLPLVTNLVTTCPFYFGDSPGLPFRFYRARCQ